jgi:hypothetical protein
MTQATKTKRPLARINALSYAILLRELIESPSTLRELSAATGLAYTTIREAMHAWHIAKIVYIVGYNKDARGRDNERLWSFGLDRRDAKRFAFTQSERQARSRAKKRAIQLVNILSPNQGIWNVSQAN